MKSDLFFDRDLSWLLFNERVLMEAEKENLPLMERVNFLSIFSANLDEFYRVRMPVLLALNKLERQDKGKKQDILPQARELICSQQQRFGQLLIGRIVPLLSRQKIRLLYNEPLPDEIAGEVNEYFYSQVLAYLKLTDLDDMKKNFFPQNSKLYFLVNLQGENGHERHVVVNIPSDQLPRFFSVAVNDKRYIVFLDDIVRYNIKVLFKNEVLTGCYSFKVTRDAQLDLADEYPGDLSEQIEKQLLKRDLGIATRFLHRPGIPLATLELIAEKFKLQQAGIVEGGMYHNLKDLSDLPVNDPILHYSLWRPLSDGEAGDTGSLFDHIEKRDQLFHTPYQSYNTVLRFFNEAATHTSVEAIFVTLYRVAKDSRIVNALISAADNGKKVVVALELKARFDEANNIRWAKKMKDAGIDIVYSDKAIKVHGKMALVMRKTDGRTKYSGLLATGNFNETTAGFYTDHILMTANSRLLAEMRHLFLFLSKGKKTADGPPVKFKHLLVAPFNLHMRLLKLIDREISNARQGIPGAVTIKVNNLEERILISKLYDASREGVRVTLIVRGICCLIPGIAGMSENITVRRIVDRYLEHGRIFIFYNQGDQKVFLSSADWMARNMYRRIEVCFPVSDEVLKTEILQLIDLQLKDNEQAVALDHCLKNINISSRSPSIRSQHEIYKSLEEKLNGHPKPVNMPADC